MSKIVYSITVKSKSKQEIESFKEFLQSSFPELSLEIKEAEEDENSKNTL